ncbi:MAG: hypothetical protein JSS34_01965 [Proteobacteria bacterium]|nr:hypothetical protein [Pseudomonadota bacterium]
MLKLRQCFIHLFLRLRKFCFEGEDSYGNRYYKNRRSEKKGGKEQEKRIVIYFGSPEAAHISPEWYGWIHFMSDKIPFKKVLSQNQNRCVPSWTKHLFETRNSVKSLNVSKNSAYVRWIPKEEIMKEPSERG